MSSAVAHAQGTQATLLLSVCAFCRLHVSGELVAVWRPDSDDRTGHGDPNYPNYRGADSTADCPSNVTCADGGTDEHRDPYRSAIPSPPDEHAAPY